MSGRTVQSKKASVNFKKVVFTGALLDDKSARNCPCFMKNNCTKYDTA
jgi:hypothetical protein